MTELGLFKDIVDQATHERTVARFRERGIVLPTFAQLADPRTIPASVRERLAAVDPDAPDPLNLFRVHWYNGADRRGLVEVPMHLVLPRAITGVDATIVVALGDRFPMINAHKVLAAYGCLAPRVITGQFDPVDDRAIWPSTGNYCRGGVAISRIMASRGVAVLPENMSRERFQWLERWVSEPGDIVRTPGSESNVKEIYDTCHELAKDEKNVIFNQFSEFGNHLVHYAVTGRALQHVYEAYSAQHRGARLTAFVSATGSAGTIAAGDYLKDHHGTRIVAVEAAECPTLLYNGFGEHNIQGIGDKHIPYIHNVYNTDFVVGVSDRATDELTLLYNTDAGRRYLVDRRGVTDAQIAQLEHLGYSGICNVLAAIKTARTMGYGKDDVIITVATDSGAMYRSEHDALIAKHFGGRFDDVSAGEAYGQHVLGASSEHVMELTKIDRDRMFNLGYFTWVEQQGVALEDFVARRDQAYWRGLRSFLPAWDELIARFNAEVAG